MRHGHVQPIKLAGVQARLGQYVRVDRGLSVEDVAGCAVFFMYTAESTGMAFTWFAIATTGISISSPVVFTLVLKYLPGEFIGMGTGIANCGQQTGGMVAPALFGYFIHVFHGSYFAVFMFVIATLVTAHITALTINTNVSTPVTPSVLA